MPHLYYEHAADGWVAGKRFTQHVLECTEEEAHAILGGFWRLATDDEIAAARPASPAPAKPARKARP